MTNSDAKPIFEPISYTPEQAALVTGRSRSRIFKAIKDKELTARKDGKATLLERDELHRWVRSLPAIGRQPVAA
jgi:excisionase family DNA binding protein